MAAFILKRGKSDKLPALITDGTLYFVSDENCWYLDYQAKRYKINGNMTASDVGALSKDTLYAGSATAGGSATSAVNLDSIDMSISDTFDTVWTERSCTA